MYRLFVGRKWELRIIRHVLLFVVMVLVFSWVAHSRSEGEGGFLASLLVVFTNAFFFFGYAYITVYLLIPHILAKKKYVLFITLFVLAGLLLSAMKFLFSDYIFYQAISPEDASVDRFLSLPALLVNTKDMTFIVAVFAIVKFARDHYIVESDIRELKQKGLEAEIKLLEHQMDPHVIFNNFNNLYSISIYRPEYLKATVKKFRSILHFLFKESKNEKVLLSKEVDMIENYIGLEQLRYGERLQISFTKHGDFQGLEIVPLILYPFVENCFVHGAGEDPLPSWIRIEMSVNGSNLRFSTANSVSEQVGRNHSRERKQGQ